jgi:hypothetical protein
MLDLALDIMLYAALVVVAAVGFALLFVGGWAIRKWTEKEME